MQALKDALEPSLGYGVTQLIYVLIVSVVDLAFTHGAFQFYRLMRFVTFKIGCAIENKKTSVASPDDAPNTGFAILGFLIPIVGLILYLVNKDTTPLKAKSAGKGALIGFCVTVVCSIIYGAVVGSLLGSMLY